MTKFAVEKIVEVKGRIPFFKLFVDGCCQVDSYEEELAKNGSTFSSQVKTVKSYMDFYSNGMILPRTKYSILKVKGSKQTFFEFKSKDLRYYGFQHCGAMIICSVEKNDKSEQKLDIIRVSNICTEFLKEFNDGTKGIA